MITRDSVLSDFTTYYDVLDYDPEHSLFFDIETTGLSAASSSVFLIGVIFRQNDSWTLRQWLTESPAEELLLIQTFYDLASRYQTLIHFNGTTFDLPFLDKRAKKMKLDFELSNIHSLDLYQSFRPVKKMIPTTHSKQINLEQFVGWRRTDQLTGKHMISLYDLFVKSHEPSVCELLLLHNHDDLLGMTKILPLASYLQLLPAHLSNCIQSAKLIRQDDEQLTVRFTLQYSVPESSQITADLSLTQDTGILYIPLIQDELKYFFPDYKNYYYLPYEDQAIHKSIACYIDKDCRVAAKPATCYIKKKSLFAFQPEPIFVPAFYKEYGDKVSYYEWTQNAHTDSPEFFTYIRSIIKHLVDTL